MKNLASSIVVEILKLRRSSILLVTIILFAFIPTMMGLLMLLSQHPELAARMGLVGTKASFFSSNNWMGFLAMMNQMIAAIGIIGFGFVISWVFGREHMEHTITSIIALPVKRNTMVLAKFVVSLIWCSLLVLVMYAAGLVIGKVVHMQGWSSEGFASFNRIFFVTAFLAFVVSTPVALLAGWTRGIIAPIGFVILTMILAQIIAAVGLGPVFPWAIPGIYTVPVKSPGYALTTASYVIVLLTFLTGLIGTTIWWNRADHN